MHWLQQMIHWHPVLSGMMAMAVLNCAVTSLPTPAASGNKFYQWLFNFGHALVLALPRIYAQYKTNGAPPANG
jgi:hypothetical protein